MVVVYSTAPCWDAFFRLRRCIVVDIFVANGIELSIKKCCDGVVHVTCVLWGGFVLLLVVI